MTLEEIEKQLELEYPVIVENLKKKYGIDNIQCFICRSYWSVPDYVKPPWRCPDCQPKNKRASKKIRRIAARKRIAGFAVKG